MKKPTKPTKPTKSVRSARRPRVPVSPGQHAFSPSSTAPGILSADIVKGKGGVEAVVVRLAPHYLIVITGGDKPTVSMACTHHGFVAEAFELNGQLEQVITHVRQRFPMLRVD
ncbi:MAG: hypothetical protein WCJ96_10295 [Verrucomicrobiota bacterium]